jgi:hypothetical protein
VASPLRELRHELLHLHKALIDSERRRYERENGRVEDGLPLLQLVSNDESFAWLRALTTLIVQFDERMDAKEPMTKEAERQLVDETRALIDAAEALGDFQSNYARVIHANPDALFVHARALRELQRLG